MHKDQKIIKKILATTLAANVLIGGEGILGKENVASAWWWSKKHTLEEIDSICRNNKDSVEECLNLSRRLDNTDQAQVFIEAALSLKSECDNNESTYEKAIDLQKRIKDLENKVNVELNLQEIEKRRKAEELEQETARIENEHRRKLEEQKLQMEKEERERLEEINNAKASLSEKVFSIMRKARQEIELSENIEHIKALSDEIEEKILLVDNLNRIDGIEALIAELQNEIGNVLTEEAKIRQENFEKKLKEEKAGLINIAENLQNLLSNLNDKNENFEVINKLIEEHRNMIDSLENLESVNELQKDFNEIRLKIDSLLEIQAKEESEKRALEELEREIENLRDPQKQLEMLAEGKLLLDDVIGGNQKAKTKSMALVKAYDKYNKGGKIVPSKGLLLYGPPGTGKTSFVTAFAAKQGLELFFVNPSLVMGDNGERKLLETFEQAKKAAQISGKSVILLIDEIDAVAQKRSSSTSDKVLVMLMNEIDKLKASDNVIVFATTNRREALDQAIIRSGRLDQSVEVGYPNAEDKEKIINIYLKHLKVAEDLNVKSIIDKMRGFCGADIKRVIDIAITSAMERQNVEKFGSIVITNADFQAGIATIMDEKTAVY